jgi:hypothetical protein
MSVIETLRSSIRTGEIVTIVYHGGSNPGAHREVFPIQILVGDEKVRARCISSGTTKVFIVDKISIVNSDGVLELAKDVTQHKSYKTIQDLLTNVELQLKDKLLHIDYADDYLQVHKVWKNGKPQKGTIIELVFSEHYSESEYDFETNSIVDIIKVRNRPWCINGSLAKTNSFKDFDKAARYLLEELNRITSKGNFDL